MPKCNKGRDEKLYLSSLSFHHHSREAGIQCVVRAKRKYLMLRIRQVSGFPLRESDAKGGNG